FYAGGNVTLNGNVGVAGQIYADGRVTFNGTPDVYGSVATNSNVVLNGNPAIHYRPAAPSLSSIFSEKSELVLVSYFENCSSDAAADRNDTACAWMSPRVTYGHRLTCRWPYVVFSLPDDPSPGSRLRHPHALAGSG